MIANVHESMGIDENDDTRFGSPRVAGTRITVLDVYKHVVEFGHDRGEVADKFGISINEVEEALEYYYQHPDKMHEEREGIETAHRIAEHQ